MNVTPRPDDDDDRTVMIPVRSDDTLVEPAPPTRTRLRAFAPVAGIILIAMIAGSLIAAGAFFLLRGGKPASVSSQRAPEAAAPHATPRAGLPPSAPAPASAPAPSSSPTPDKPFSPRQMLNEIFEGRDRGHSVTASVDKGAVRISSSRPGYVYVLAAGSDVAVLFVAVLFPGATDTNNQIRPGQTLKLPDAQWPTNAQFLAIVSDEPRDFGAVGPMAGKVVCGSTSGCSESYGAVVFSSRAVSEAPRASDTARAPAPPKAAAPRPTPAVSRRCSDILERASLGEVLTAEEYTFLRRDCR